VRSTSCRTSANRSYRWIAVFTIVALLGFAGYVWAAGSPDETLTNTRPGTKVVPMGQDAKATKAERTLTADGAQAVATTAASPRSGVTPLAPPANDECEGAVVIPSGSLPVVTAPISMLEATPVDVDEGVFPCAATDRSLWFSFSPVATGAYTITTCQGNGAPLSTVYDTVLAVFDSSAGVCPSAASLACADSPGCSGPPPGAPYNDQASTSAVLVAGNTYFIVAGHWADDIAAGGVGVVPGLDNVSIRIDLSPAPDNDTCASPTPLSLGKATYGTTASATNDYRANGLASCFSGVGQLPTTANGLDVVFSFVPPANGKYSFRYVQDDASAALRTGNSPALYLTDNCPAPNPLAPVPGCIKGANRMNDQTTGNGNRSEEIDCVTLTGGTPYYLFFDDRFTANSGGPLVMEVTECVNETEPNDDIASANSGPNCFTTGTGLAGDVDFFSLGTPPAGSKVFAGIDAAAANNSDFEMRITNATDTLQYDDNDGTSWIGSNSAVIGGTPADGNPIYVRVNSKAVASEPYHLYTRVETGVAENENAEGGALPSNNSYVFGKTLTGGGFVKGIVRFNDVNEDPSVLGIDSDCFRFIANEGDNIVAFSDNNADRSVGNFTNIWPTLRDLLLDPPNATRFIGQVYRNLLTASPATLTGVTPSITSNFMSYRARYTGMYMLCWGPTIDDNVDQFEVPDTGAYPLPWQGSMSINCGPIPNPTTFVTDVALAEAGPAGPVNTGSVFDYTITLTNPSAQAAMDVRILDTLPSELAFLGLTVNDGFDGANTACFTLPSPGTADDPIDCINYSIAPGASVVYTLTVQVNNCIGAGIDIAHSAAITSTTTNDPNLANNSGGSSFTTSQSGSCQDLLCDGAGCITNECTINDHCEGATCVSDPLNCDDNSLCTIDTCDPADAVTPCDNNSEQLGDLCFDGNDCTVDDCDPLLFCVFPATASGSACDDFLGCTNGDLCDGAGTCVGVSVCDDLQPCTDDFADEFNNCFCEHFVSFPGTLCSDGNPCTTGTTCDGFGGAVANCTGGSPTICDDGDACTTDSCDTVLGCVTTPVICDDGNACNGAETCNSATGCVAGTPVVCTASDQCHVAGTCDTGTGLCSNPNAANGTTCDDGNGATNGDVCTDGVCAGSFCTSLDDPKNRSYYKKLCNNRHAGVELTNADAVCVGENTATFAGITLRSQVCEVLTSGGPGKCDKAEADLMALALNICKQRVCPNDAFDSTCGGNSTVGQNFSEADSLVAAPGRTNATCQDASCLAEEINDQPGLLPE
jgi:uncharacterized repeat protein (TIGR01451 family)